MYFWTEPPVTEVPEILLDSLLHVTPKNSTSYELQTKIQSKSGI